MRLVNLASDHIVKKMYHKLETLSGMGHSNWVSLIELRLYKKTKETFLSEPYLFINIPKYRHAIAQLRLSSRHLEIETGRSPYHPCKFRILCSMSR